MLLRKPVGNNYRISRGHAADAGIHQFAVPPHNRKKKHH